MQTRNSTYASDVLIQVQALRRAISSFNPQPLELIAHGIKEGNFDRIILTGMGASFYALYPTWLYLTQASLPVLWLDTAELLHYAKNQITNKTLIWIVSQSGRSAEIISLIESKHIFQPASVIATTNDLNSPLAEFISQSKNQSVIIQIDAEPENTVSTRTYMNSLALCQLGGRVLLGEDLEPSYSSLEASIDSMESYLDKFDEHFKVIGEKVGKPNHLVLLGRGSSIASVYCGALIIGEAGSSPAIGMPAGQFRHGPLEMCGENLTVILLAGEPITQHLNIRLANDIASCGSPIFWLGLEVEGIPTLPMSTAEGIGLPLAETLPLQLLTIHLAQQAGLVPGEFKHIGKVTLEE